MQLHLIIQGHVQGVFFRAETQEKAESLNLKGWVRNLPDGQVEILAQGDEEKLEKLFQWAQIGPSRAQVTNVISEWHHRHDTLQDFEIKI